MTFQVCSVGSNFYHDAILDWNFLSAIVKSLQNMETFKTEVNEQLVQTARR